MEEIEVLQPKNTDGNPTKGKKNRKPLVISIVFIFILLGIAGGLYYLYTGQQEENDENTAYLILEDNESLDDYEAYLKHFPNGLHAEEVKERYNRLQKMYSEWRGLAIGGTRYEYERFKKNYSNSILAYQCDIKIDSLDWIAAMEDGSPEAIATYIEEHPNGRYLSEASIAQEKISEAQPSDEEKIAIEMALSTFFKAFGNNDEETLNTCITPVMTKFLSKSNATKVDVAGIIARTYNEHIKSCRFALNNDYAIKKSRNEAGETVYHVSFSTDQYIERDNEGKTFGSYTAEATMTEQFKISSLTMTEASRR